MSELKIQRYKELMSRVCRYASEIGLETNGLVRDSYNPSEDSWVISVSWKDRIDNSAILYEPKDRFKPNFNRHLDFPVITGTRRQIEKYKRKAEEKGAEWFLKKSIAFGGFVEPSPEFLALPEMKQVGIAFHEAFHRTPKLFCGRKEAHLPYGWEEPKALVAGYLATIGYFRNTPGEQEARTDWQKRLALAEKVSKFHEELYQVCGFRVGEDGRPLSTERILQDKEAVLARARAEIGLELGSPVNNAFFTYWYYFYSMLPRSYDAVRGIEDPKQIMDKLKTLEI